MRAGNWKPSKGRKARVKCLLKLTTILYSCDCYKIVSSLHFINMSLSVATANYVRIINIQYYLFSICCDGISIRPHTLSFIQDKGGSIGCKASFLLQIYVHNSLEVFDVNPPTGNGRSGGTRISSLLKYYI